MFFSEMERAKKWKRIKYSKKCESEKIAGGTLCESMRQLKELKSITIQFD